MIGTYVSHARARQVKDHDEKYYKVPAVVAASAPRSPGVRVKVGCQRFWFAAAHF